MPEIGRYRPIRRPPFPVNEPLNIGLRMQYQETSQWCWIAVATSIHHFYNPSSTRTQCEVMTIAGQTINEFSLSTGACPDPAVVAANPNLAGQLADPYNSNALWCLEGRIAPAYDKSGGAGDALNVNDNWNSPALPSITLEEIAAELNALRPVVVDITWKSGEQHFVAIAGVLNDRLLICDPANGESPINYASFPGEYRGGGHPALRGLEGHSKRHAYVLVHLRAISPSQDWGQVCCESLLPTRVEESLASSRSGLRLVKPTSE